MATPEELLKAEVTEVLALEQSLQDREAELMANEQFRNFLEFQRTTTKRIAEFWKEVETQMIDKDIKSIKGDWGSLTIAERLNWETNEDLPAKFYKKVVDTKKISDTYRLEGKEPKGAIKGTTQYLVKHLKSEALKEII